MSFEDSELELENEEYDKEIIKQKEDTIIINLTNADGYTDPYPILITEKVSLLKGIFARDFGIQDSKDIYFQYKGKILKENETFKEIGIESDDNVNVLLGLPSSNESAKTDSSIEKVKTDSSIKSAQSDSSTKNIKTDFIKINIKNAKGVTSPYLINLHEKVSTLIEKYQKEKGSNKEGKVIFRLKGKKLKDSDTFNELGIKSDEIIEEEEEEEEPLVQINNSLRVGIINDEGKSADFEVLSTDIVKTIFKKYKNDNGLLRKSVCFKYNGNMLKGNETFEQIGITSGQNIQAKIDEENITLNVRNVDGEWDSYDVKITDQVRDLKKRYSKKKGNYDLNKYFFHCKGTNLKDSKTFKEIGIESDDNIYVLIRLLEGY